jgi:hypothetical protein
MSARYNPKSTTKGVNKNGFIPMRSNLFGENIRTLLILKNGYWALALHIKHFMEWV